SRRFRVGRGILKLVREKAMEMGATLPKGTEQLFRFEKRERSVLTEAQQGDNDLVDEIGMSFLLEKWDDLDLDAFWYQNQG
ncbi:hypothetical protein LTR70_010628, partial [Exophiala xenobiotica]